MPMLPRRRLVLAGAAAAALPMQSARAQSAGYPNKALKIIAASPPGGLLDAYSRLYAEQYTAKYNLPAVVENRPGASGIIATEAMLKSPADGYTILLGSTGMYWQTRVLYRKLPFDLARDIAPITVYPTGPLVFAAAERTGIRDFKGMVEYARKNQTTMGNYVTGSYQQVLAGTLNRESGTRIEMVHYKGEVPMWVDMASGQLDIAIGSFLAFSNVKEKGLRPIAVTGSSRSPRLPELQTMIEQGFTSPVAKLEAAIPMVANSAVPEDILELLARLAVEGNDTPRARAMRESLAIPDVTKGRADALRMWREEAPIWIREVQALGLKID